MAPHHFVVNSPQNVGDRKAALAARDFRMENYLQEQVAQLVSKFGIIASVEGVEDFVGLFNEVRAQSGVSLLAIPRAALRGAKALLHGYKFFKPLAGGEGGPGCWQRFAARGGRPIWLASCSCPGRHRVSAEHGHRGLSTLRREV